MNADGDAGVPVTGVGIKIYRFCLHESENGLSKRNTGIKLAR